MKATQRQWRGSHLWLETSRVTRGTVCLFALAWGRLALHSARCANMGWQCAGTGPASASGRAVSKRTAHWKIDKFLGTAERDFILETSTATEPFLIMYYRVIFFFFFLWWARVEKALLIAKPWKKTCKAEPWHTSAAWFLSFNSSVPGRALVKLIPSSPFLGRLLTSKTSESTWIALFRFILCPPTYTLWWAQNSRGQVFAYLPPCLCFQSEINDIFEIDFCLLSLLSVFYYQVPAENNLRIKGWLGG